MVHQETEKVKLTAKTLDFTLFLTPLKQFLAMLLYEQFETLGYIFYPV